MDSRIRSALSVYAFGLLGVFLLTTPWTPVWEQAARALAPRAAEPWILSGWARGVVSGLGALDLAVALQSGADLWRRIRNGPGSKGS